MMTPGQTAELAGFFRIDRFTIFREYLQLVFLSYLYRQRQADRVYFKGGTKIWIFPQFCRCQPLTN